jgi:hypothetical protein
VSERNDLRAIETAIRDGYARTMFDGVIRTTVATGAQEPVPYIRGVAFEEVRLDGEFPDTELVLLFRARSHPGVPFGRRRRLWEEDGSPIEMVDILIGVHLKENIESGEPGLPRDPEVDASGIAWF